MSVEVDKLHYEDIAGEIEAERMIMMIIMNESVLTTTDPVWHRFIDGLVILSIGVATGAFVMGYIFVNQPASSRSDIRLEQMPERYRVNQQNNSSVATPKIEEI